LYPDSNRAAARPAPDPVPRSWPRGRRAARPVPQGPRVLPGRPAPPARPRRWPPGGRRAAPPVSNA